MADPKVPTDILVYGNILVMADPKVPTDAPQPRPLRHRPRLDLALDAHCRHAPNVCKKNRSASSVHATEGRVVARRARCETPRGIARTEPSTRASTRRPTAEAGMCTGTRHGHARRQAPRRRGYDLSERRPRGVGVQQLLGNVADELGHLGLDRRRQCIPELVDGRAPLWRI